MVCHRFHDPNRLRNRVKISRTLPVFYSRRQSLHTSHEQHSQLRVCRVSYLPACVDVCNNHRRTTVHAALFRSPWPLFSGFDISRGCRRSTLRRRQSRVDFHRGEQRHQLPSNVSSLSTPCGVRVPLEVDHTKSLLDIWKQRSSWILYINAWREFGLLLN